MGPQLLVIAYKQLLILLSREVRHGSNMTKANRN